jgi:hypothetical protein
MIDLLDLQRDPAWNRFCGWAEQLGLGFHPDTRGADYVEADGSPTLTADEAAQYDADMEAVFDRTIDPYEVGLAIIEMEQQLHIKEL